MAMEFVIELSFICGLWTWVFFSFPFWA
jgi:hypothetical protein